MGLETVIVAFFVIGLIIVVACSLTIGANNLVKSSHEGYTSFSQSAIDRFHTNIKISNATVTDDHIHLTVENTGETKLSDFDQWDVLVVSNSQASYLKKNDGFSYKFIKDFVNPEILDPGESIDLNLTSTLYSGSAYVTVSTENGITSSAIVQ